MSAPRSVAAAETLTREESNALARRVLDMVNGSQAQVQVGSDASSNIQFARGEPHIVGENTSVSVVLQVESGRRGASGSTNQLDDSSLRLLVREVEALIPEHRTPAEWEPVPPQAYPEGPPIYFDANREAMTGDAQAEIFQQARSAADADESRTLLLTGTTRDGTFLIENGEVTKPIKNFRFTESPFFVFNQLEACGEPVRASRAVVAPRLKLRDFSFTSMTDAV